MNPETIQALKSCLMQMVNSQTKEQELQAGQQLIEWYDANGILISKDLLNNLEVNTAHGYAISQQEAAACLYDRIRTVRFIKGIYKALQDLDNLFPNQTKHILYAGCGPYLTLLLPVLPFLMAGLYEFTLLEINEASYHKASDTIEKCGLHLSHRIQLIQADATSYKIAQKWHLIISETMYNALEREPQVAIMLHLKQQLIAGGIFIPEQIVLKCAYSRLADEPYLISQENTSTDFATSAATTFPSRIFDKELLAFDGDTTFFSDDLVFKSEWLKVPENFSNTPDICIYTTVHVYQHIAIYQAESLITNPVCVNNFYAIDNINPFRLVLRLSNQPKWFVISKP